VKALLDGGVRSAASVTTAAVPTVVTMGLRVAGVGNRGG
jgi:hypothetical protein